MQHADAEIPQQKSGIFTYTTKAIASVIAPPWIETHSSDPRLMPLATRND